MDFIDLKAQRQRIKTEIDTAIATVLDHGRFIMGPEVSAFEQELSAYGQAKHTLACGSGTDALIIPLMAWNIGAGDAVFCPSFTFCATAEAIALVGATPVFTDVDRGTYNIDISSLKRAIAEVKANGELVPRAIMAVDIFGQSADYKALAEIAKSEGLKLISDSAQGFGSTLDGKHPIHWADVTTTSFFPAKPLGCYGDGGAVLTNDADLLKIMQSVRNHGQGTDKYDNVRIGLNSRLDTIQAAILLEKLKIFDDEIEKRNVVANRYIEGLRGNVMQVPTVMDGVISTWAQFTIEVEDPESFGASLREKGIPTARYYPKPVHHQTAYKHYPVEGCGLPNTDDCLGKIISLPMHPYLDEQMQDIIIDACKSA
ncbi:MAG: aminotransferase DegT [Robiginitomaculum sp.]|nr:MAG: aminotransferase DegT [Robiginitomaculum sp.]